LAVKELKLYDIEEQLHLLGKITKVLKNHEHSSVSSLESANHKIKLLRPHPIPTKHLKMVRLKYGH